MTENTPMERMVIGLAGVLGALGVGLGAFGAHGLEGWLEGQADAARRLEWWQTAVLYHLLHTVALAVSARLMNRGLAARLAAIGFASGTLLFSGTLYAMALGAPRALGAVTPLGGLALIAGWIAFALSALRKPA